MLVLVGVSFILSLRLVNFPLRRPQAREQLLCRVLATAALEEGERQAAVHDLVDARLKKRKFRAKI